MSKKHKLTLYKTHSGESIYVARSHISFPLIFTRSYLPIQNLGDRHPNTVQLASWLVHVLCDVKATWYQEAYYSVSWIHHGSTSCWYLYFTFLVKVPPPPFHYSLGSYLYLFLVIHFTESYLIARSVPVLKLPKKCIIPSSRDKGIGVKVYALISPS